MKRISLELLPVTETFVVFYYLNYSTASIFWCVLYFIIIIIIGRLNNVCWTERDLCNATYKASEQEVQIFLFWRVLDACFYLVNNVRWTERDFCNATYKASEQEVQVFLIWKVFYVFFYLVNPLELWVAE